MIKLDIANFGFIRQKDSLPDALPAAVLQSLLEAAAWCAPRSTYVSQLRSAELDPTTILDIPSYSEMLEIDVWLETKRASYERAVDKIVQTRSTLLHESRTATPGAGDVLSNGRLLLYWPMETVHCGASEAGSRGFFDPHDGPPWDTWFHYSNDTIFSYVPDSMISLAQDGIDGNPVDCIRWGKWSAILAEQNLRSD